MLETFKHAPKINNRKPLGKPKNIPDLLLDWVDELVSQLMKSREIDEYKFIDRLNDAVYATAYAVSFFLNKPRFARKEHSRAKTLDIVNRRKELLQLISKIQNELNRRAMKSPPTQKQRDNITWLKRMFSCTSTCKLTIIKESLKQHLNIVKLRIRKDEEEATRKSVRFSEPKRVIWQRPEISNTPIETIRNYWAEFIGSERKFEKTPYLEGWTERHKIKPEDTKLPEFDLNEWQKVIKSTKPWKAPGPDGIYAFWWKRKAANTLLYSLGFTHDYEKVGKCLAGLAKAELFFCIKVETQQTLQITGQSAV